MKTIGMQIGASTPPAALAGVVGHVEKLGFGEIWLAEDYFELGGVSSVATALAGSESIPVGLGVVAARVRHPGVTAMEFATLGGMYPGRFMAGLGHGAPGWIRQMGLEPSSPVGLLREATEVIRRLLDGETVTQDGAYFRLVDVSLDHPPPASVPLYYGVQGPVSLRLSGELADGTLLGWFSSPGSVAWARQRIDEGRARGNQAGQHGVAALCLLSISRDDPDGAGRRMARWSAAMLAGLAGSPALAGTDEGEELREIAATAEPAELAEKVPLRLLRRFAATGNPEDCAATVADLLEAGADRVVLVPNPAGYRSTAEMMEQITLAQTLLG